MYFSGRAELTTGEMRDAGKRGPEAGGGAKGLEEEVVGFVHIFFRGSVIDTVRRIRNERTGYGVFQRRRRKYGR